MSSVGVLADEDYSAADSPEADPGVELQTSTATFGGAAPLATTRTVQHWSGQATNPVDGVTYEYNMVGADPSTDGSASIGVDIIPMDLTVGGRQFNGSEVVNAVLASPLFQANSYAMTTRATNAMRGKGTGGALSAGNDGVQLLDATMRAQFNKTGAGATYHLYLDTPVVYDPVSLDAGDNGVTFTTLITYALVDQRWFATRIQNLKARLHLDPTRLSIFLTNDVVLFTGPDPVAGCCILGAHGAGPATSSSIGSAHGNGNQPVQTWVWASWLTPGFFSSRTAWAKQDVYSLSHEIVEWAVNPFGSNTVQGWFSDKAPQYGCSSLLETGDPVLGYGFAKGVNPLREHFSDGTYHLSDEALLPWFMRTTPETQAAQHGSAGRYTFLGDLNPAATFHQPAPTC